MSEIDREAIEDKLEELRLEHRDLDDVIHRLQQLGAVEQLQLQRMKKRKLKLKDEINRLEDQLIPDILA
jgi:hypothetical protein